MKNLKIILVLTTILTGCMYKNNNQQNENLLGTVVAATQNAMPSFFPPPQVITPTTMQTPYTVTTPTEIKTTATAISIENPVFTTIPGIGTSALCGDDLIAYIGTKPEFAKDLFEHHAKGIYLIVLLELDNISEQKIQIWDEDYSIEATLNNVPVVYLPDKSATGYLFITRGNNLHQDLIKPEVDWKTYLAFDVDPSSQDYVLLVQPGSEIGNTLCDVRIEIEN